ncbi:MAG: TonB-dependent receptor [Quisquiliibacterium sp.]
MLVDKRWSLPLLALTVCCCAHAQQMGEVVVTATRDERVIERTLSDVTVIDAEQIRRSGSASLPELLQAFGGIEISQNGLNGATSGIFVRGTKTSQTVVLLDGVRLENPTSGTANLEFLPLSSIDRVEIVRGPLSSLYGSGAMGGVIQIFTRQGGGPTQQTGSIAVGSLGTSQARFGISGSAGPSGSTRYAIGVFADRTGGYEISMTGSPSFQQDRDANRQHGANASVRQALPGGWLIGANLLSTGGRVDYDDAWSQPRNTRMHYRSSAATGFLKGRPGSNWQTELSLGQTRIEYRFDAFTFEPRADTTSGAWLNRVKLPAGSLLFGLEQMQQKLSGQGVVTGEYAYLRDSRRTDSVFVGYEFAAREHLLRLQARRDAIQDFGSEPTGTIAYGYQLTDRWLLRGSLASAFRAPTFDDLFSPFGSNPNLRPERSRGLELAAEYRHAASRLRLTAFASRISDAIELDAFYTPQNIESARVRGLTLEGSHRLGALTLRAAATLQDPRGERVDPVSGALQAGQLSRRARRYASLGADWQLGAARLGVGWLLQSRRGDSDGSAIAGYGVQSGGLRATGKCGRQALSDRYRLCDAAAKHFCRPAPERALMAGVARVI